MNCRSTASSHHPVVFEESDMVGGIARTEVYKGYRYDIGGHRFFTKVKPVRDLWREILPNDFLKPAADEPHLLSAASISPIRSSR